MKILFICTHNRCRSILAEAVTNHLSQGLIEARSAGSQPAGEVHPLSLKYLNESGVSIAGLKSQSWDEFESWQPNVVITVCDSAAGESCPVWFGHSVKAHWGLKDPSAIEGSEEEIASAFRNTISLIEKRIESLLNQDPENRTQEELRHILESLAN